MISIFWGAFYFKEFRQTSLAVKGLAVLVCLLYIGAISAIAASHK